MGVCASSPYATIAKMTSADGKGSVVRASESFRGPSSIVVMDMVGGSKEYKKPIPASLVLSENPSCYLCNSESMYIDTCMPRVPEEEYLLPGRIYFLVPLSYSHSPLSLPLLCDLAVKTSSALANPNYYRTNNHRASVHRRSFDSCFHCQSACNWC